MGASDECLVGKIHTVLFHRGQSAGQESQILHN